jgi:hypothetical protein
VIRSAPGLPIATTRRQGPTPTVGAMLDASRSPGARVCSPPRLSSCSPRALLSHTPVPGAVMPGAVPGRARDGAGTAVHVDRGDVRRRGSDPSQAWPPASTPSSSACPRWRGRRTRPAPLRDEPGRRAGRRPGARRRRPPTCLRAAVEQQQHRGSTGPPIAGGGLMARCQPSTSTPIAGRTAGVKAARSASVTSAVLGHVPREARATSRGAARPRPRRRRVPGSRPGAGWHRVAGPQRSTVRGVQARVDLGSCAKRASRMYPK